MAFIRIESDNQSALAGFIAGLEFCNDGSIAIIDNDDTYVLLEDEDDSDEYKTYKLDIETGFLSLQGETE